MDAATRTIRRKERKMTIMQLVSGVGTMAGILNIILGIRDRSKWGICIGILMTIIEASYLIGTIGG